MTVNGDFENNSECLSCTVRTFQFVQHALPFLNVSLKFLIKQANKFIRIHFRTRVFSNEIN